MNKKTIALIPAISTASLLIGGTALGGFPIILCATGSAFAAYREGQRKEAIVQTTEGTVSITNSYDQEKGHKVKGIAYPWPHPMEILDKALNLAMTGTILGTSSVGFIVTIAKVTCSVISEIKDYSQLSALKKQLMELGQKILTNKSTTVDPDKNHSQSHSKSSATDQQEHRK